MIWGDHGYYQITPPGNYVACSVFSRDGDEPIYTQIKHVKDEPGHVMATADSHPWLTKVQIDAINLPHRALYRHREAVAVRDDAFLSGVWESACKVDAREPVQRQAWASAYETTIEGKSGGFIPSKPAGDASSRTARVLIERNRLRAARNFEAADLIKRVVTGGGVTVEDDKRGTWYWMGDAA